MTEVINLKLPESWEQLTRKQFKYFLQMAALGLSLGAVKIYCFMRWSGLKVIGRNPDGWLLKLKHKKEMFTVPRYQIAEAAAALDYLLEMPQSPVRLDKVKGRKAPAADFQGVPFRNFIYCDNLYQGYIASQDDSYLDRLAEMVYDLPEKALPLTEDLRLNMFYWFASLKNLFARQFCNFFQPAGSMMSGNALGVDPRKAVADAMNAQIRALTKGDITKEDRVLDMDVWRALTELDALAKEEAEMERLHKSQS